MFKCHNNLDLVNDLVLKKKYLDKQKETNLLYNEVIIGGYKHETYKKFLVVLSEYNDLYDEVLNHIKNLK